MENDFLIRTYKGYHHGELTEAQQTSSFRLGSLFYTKAGLIMTILFSCWGLCSFSVIGMMVGNFVPVEMKKYGASDSIITIFLTTIPYVLNMVITPVLSFRSDRLRSRWGRRMPYILLSAPFITIFLILLGISPQISGWLIARFPALPSNLGWIVIGVFLIGYQVFYLFMGTIIYYLFPDVIPQHFIGRFMALFNLVGSATAFVFSKWLLPYGEHYLSILYTVIAIFYLISIFILFLTVKEGSYPAFDESQAAPGFIASVKSYFRDCFSIPFYYAFFCAIALSDVSTICRNNFNFLYAKNTLHLSYAEFGEIMAWYGLVGVILSYPVGILVDKFHSIRIYFLGLVLVILVNFFSFFIVRDYNTFLVTTMLLGVVYTIQTAATLPLFVAILPKEKYGQFSSANALFRALFTTIVGTGGGVFLDWVADYQYIYVWDFIFTVLALVSFIILCIQFKRHGGMKHYVAPVRQ